jgi:hypothetical protein
MSDSARREDDAQKKLDERESEATSDETVSDIDDTEKESGSDTSKRVPSPEGRLDEPDELKDAGPM